MDKVIALLPRLKDVFVYAAVPNPDKVLIKPAQEAEWRRETQMLMGKIEETIGRG